MARALLKNPDIYIFDETFANLDSETRNAFENIINFDLKNKTVILIEHSNDLNICFDNILNVNDYTTN